MAPKHRLYTPEIAETILERLADGEGLATICRDEGMPSRGAVREWVERDHEGFAARYASARARGLEHAADELLEIADDGTNDTYETENGTRTDHDVVQRSRLRVDTRKWLLSKLLPKTYGDRVDLNHTGTVDVRAVDETVLDDRLAALERIMSATPLVVIPGVAEPDDGGGE